MLVSKIASIFEEQNATVKVLKDGEPKAISADNKYVQVAMQAYREHTGNFDAQPRISVGGTYSRYLESSFEVGMTTKTMMEIQLLIFLKQHQINFMLNGLLMIIKLLKMLLI